MGLSAYQQRKQIHDYAETLESALRTAELKSLGFKQAKNRSARRQQRDKDDQAHFGVEAAKRYSRALRALRAEVPTPPAAIAHLFDPTDPSTVECQPPSTNGQAESRMESSTASPPPGSSRNTKQKARSSRRPSRRGPTPWLLVGGASIILAGLLSERLNWSNAWLATALLLAALGLLLEASRSVWTSTALSEHLRAYSVRSLAIAAAIGAISLLAWLEPTPTTVNQPANTTPGNQVEGVANNPTAVSSGSVEETPPPVSSSTPRQIGEALVDRSGAATYLYLLSPTGSAVRAVRFGDGEWRGVAADGIVPIPTDAVQLISSDGRRVAPFEAVIVHEADLALLVQGDVLVDTSTTILLDQHVVPYHHGEPTADAPIFNLAVAARSNAPTTGELRVAINDSAIGHTLPANVRIRAGTNTIAITHPTPGRLDAVGSRLVVRDGVLFVDPTTVVAVTLEPKHAFSILNLRESQVQVNGHDITTDIFQTYLAERSMTTVSSNDGDTLWHGSIDTDTVLLVLDANPEAARPEHAVERRTAELAAEPSCEEAVGLLFDTLFPQSTIAYPTGIFRGKAGVEMSFAQTTNLLVRTAPLQVTIRAGFIDASYECTFDASTNAVQRLLVRSDDRLFATRGLTSEVSEPDETTLASLGISANTRVENAIEIEPDLMTIQSRTAITGFVAAGSPPIDALLPVSLTPIGPRASRFTVQSITLNIPVVEYATTRFTSADPEARIIVETNGTDVLTGQGTLDVRAPVGALLRASTESDPNTRYLPAEPVLLRTTGDSRVQLEQQYKVAVHIESNAPGAVLRIPGFLEEPMLLPATVDLIADTDYVIRIEPPDDRWFRRADTMSFAEDTSVNQELVRAATVTFTSDPTNATIRVTGQPTARTPAAYRFPIGTQVAYTIVGNPPIHKGFEGRVTITGDGEHPTYLERFTELERQALAGQSQPTQVPPPSARPAGTSTASEFANGLRSNIGGRSTDCGAELRALGATCFVADYTQSTANRLIDTTFAAVPGVRFLSQWVNLDRSEGRIFWYANREFMVITSRRDIAETIVTVVPY